MGKKRHSQDKLWITYKELVQDWGGKNEESGHKAQTIKKLPFYCCSLSFMAFNDPVCLTDGTIFDIVNIIPYIKKYKKNPITGRPLKSGDLIKLHFYKNQDDEYHCPVTYKVFTENSKIIAIKETGNVFSVEAYDELNKKPKYFKDLINNQPFDPKNIIILQDPNKSEQRNINEFDFVKNKEDLDFIKYKDENFFKNASNFVNLPSNYAKLLENYDKQPSEDQIRRKEVLKMINNKQNVEVEDDRIRKIKFEYDDFIKKVSLLDEELADEDTEKLKSITKIFRMSTNCFVYYIKHKKDLFDLSATHQRFSEGKASTSFTSTSLNPHYNNKLRTLSDDEIREKFIYQAIKSKHSKGYVRLNTNFGFINIQVHCEMVPRTAENFLELCEAGYYNNTIFHRLVKNFVIQGGDPTGTGKGGTSIYGKEFLDEFHPKLTHKDRGVLSMANSGKNTNSSQFFITLQATPHLDEKHSVFGEVVGNIKLLDELESIGADDKSKPNKDIVILSTEVFTNPFRDLVVELVKKDILENYLTENDKTNTAKEKKIEEKIKSNANSQGEVGKYLNKKREGGNIFIESDPYIFVKPKNTKKTYDFSFDNW